MGNLKDVSDSDTKCLSGPFINPTMAERLMEALEIFRARIYKASETLCKELCRLYDPEELEQGYWQWAAHKAKYESCQEFGKYRKKRHRKRPHHRRKQCRRGKA
jgi:hypothetical protein